MIPEGYVYFLAASLLLLSSPGPDMFYLVGRTAIQGKLAGITAALGMNIGAYVHLAAALLGLSAVLAASSTAFMMLKWVGGLYLIYLGVQLISSSRTAVDRAGTTARTSLVKVFQQGFLSDFLNPKVAVFFLAFLPQFVDPHAPNAKMQLAFLGITLNVIALLFNIGLVFLISASSTWIERGMIHRWGSRVSGFVLIGLGIRLAFQDESQ